MKQRHNNYVSIVVIIKMCPHDRIAIGTGTISIISITDLKKRLKKITENDGWCSQNWCNPVICFICDADSKKAGFLSKEACFM